MKFRGRILILDDEPQVARATTLLLRAMGHEAVESLAPSEALAWLKRDAFDLLVTDYRMLEMNGLEFVKLLRNENCHVPVVLITGYCSGIDLAYAQSIGVSAVIRKPFGLSELTEVITPLLLECEKTSQKLASELSDEWSRPEKEFREEG
jgi:two-component system, NtrC family, response regulator PilR